MKRNSTIMKMYYGKCGNSECIPRSEEYSRLLDEVIENDNEIRKQLRKYSDLLALYEKTNNSINAMYAEAMNHYYFEGFRFGILMGIDVMDDE